MEVKQSEIGQKVKASIQKSGRNPALLKSFIMTAIYALELLIGKVFKMASQKANKGIETVAKAEPEQTPVKAIKSFVKAESDGDYQLAVAKWEKQTGNKAEPDSLKVKLQRKTQEVKERENNRQSHHYRSDRGGR